MLLAGVAAYAHHSYAATYDLGKEVKLEGKLIQFIYRNPHSFVTIQAPDARAPAALGGRMGRHRAAEQSWRHAGNAEDWR